MIACNGLEYQVMEDIRQAKSEYRKEVRAKLAATTEEYRSSASATIAVNALALPEMKKAKRVLLYFSVGNEPGTLGLISKLLESGKKVCLPLCTDLDEEGHRTGTADAMEARQIKSFDDLVAGAYGIPEPAEYTKLIKPEKIDLIVLPCLACDVNCNRIGHGAGYYDKYLSKVKPHCFKMALCYEKLIGDEIPVEPHDMPVNAVVTEKQIYRWRR